MKYWIESSYKFEDKKKEFEECLVVAVDYGDKGTETIATFGMDNFSELTTLITHLNKEKEMRIERKNGFIHISDIIADYFETRKYMGYTESQAKRLFKEEFKAKGERDV